MTWEPKNKLDDEDVDVSDDDEKDKDDDRHGKASHPINSSYHFTNLLWYIFYGEEMGVVVN